MKQLFAATIIAAAFFGAASALAADMPVPVKAPLVRAPAAPWTGCYLGANGGYGWGKDEVSTAGGAIDEGKPNFKGWLAGGQAGCDYQMGAFVAGIEGMYDFADLHGGTVDPANPAIITSTKYDRLATTTLRLGVAADRSLFYVKGGLAWERSQRNLIGAGITQFSDKNTHQGTVIGGGWEYLFAPNWSMKIEYNHFNFGALNEFFVQQPGGAVFSQQNRNRNTDSVLLGLNLRFGSR